MSQFLCACIVILSCCLGTARAGSMQGRQSDTQTEPASGALPAHTNAEMLDLVRRAQDLAEQAQAELKRSREQNENLQRLVEHIQREQSQLRRELSELRSAVLLQPSGTAAALPVQDGSEERNRGADQISKSHVQETAVADRLARMEDRIEVNTAQIQEQAQTKVESDSRFKVRLFGTVLSNIYYNTAAASTEAIPVAAPPESDQATGGGHNPGATFRQTNFGFALTGPRVGGARLSADVDFDFYGGAYGEYGENVLGSLRMRTASARIDGARTSLVAALTAPMISPLNPASLAAVSYPALAESGNLWQWRPQVMVEHRAPVSEENHLILQGGLMMPFGETINGNELEGRIGYESRMGFARRINADRRLELGAGAYFQPQHFGFGRVVNSYALTGDWSIPLHSRLEFSGEAFYGNSISLSEESGGNIADVFSFTGPLNMPSTTVRGIYSMGGWAQLKGKATPKLEFNTAFGVDDRRNRDVFAGLFGSDARLANKTLSINSIYRLRSNFLFAIEYRRFWTTYPGTRARSGHLNLAVGYLF